MVACIYSLQHTVPLSVALLYRHEELERVGLTDPRVPPLLWRPPFFLCFFYDTIVEVLRKMILSHYVRQKTCSMARA